MKKVTLLGLVLVLLAFSVVPVMAAGPNNGHGNGNNAGQSSGDQNQTRHQNKGQSKNRDRNSTTNVVGKRSQISTHKRTPFYLQGTIATIDSATTLTVDVFHGNARVKQFIGGTALALTVTGTTRYFRINQGEDTERSASPVLSSSATANETPGNKEAIVFGNLHSGDIVAIHGNVVGDVFQATLITVYTKGLGGLPETEQP